MATYKLPNSGFDGVLRDDGAHIPNNPLNRDWVAYQAWVNGGGVPDPADTPPAHVATLTLDDVVAVMKQDPAQKAALDAIVAAKTKP